MSLPVQSINRFVKQYECLSNFYPVNITYENIDYPSVEHAFVAAKTSDIPTRQYIAKIKHAGAAKKVGRSIGLRKDWDSIRVNIMRYLLYLKFKAGSELAIKLMDTYPLLIKEGNYWHDNFWGDCGCSKCTDIIGLNTLGMLIMKRRDMLLKGEVTHESN